MKEGGHSLSEIAREVGLTKQRISQIINPKPYVAYKTFNRFVYFILAREVNRIKIGMTISVQKRLENLKRASPIKLELIGVIEGGRKKEKELHLRFRGFHIQSEWFEYEKPIQDYIESINRGTNE